MECIDERNKELDRELKELREQSRKLYIELYGEPKEVDLTENELKEIRKRVEKTLLKIASENYTTIADIFNISQINECELEDYEYYSGLLKNKDEYNEMLKIYREDGENELDLNRYIKLHINYFNKIQIIEYRFKHKYNWKQISQKVGLSERQCQRIKNKTLNNLIVSWLREENYFTQRCREKYSI